MAQEVPLIPILLPAWTGQSQGTVSPLVTDSDPCNSQAEAEEQRPGQGLHTGSPSHQDSPRDSYLLARVPDHMLNILRMGVEDTDTFVLIFLINCGRKKERSP